MATEFKIKRGLDIQLKGAPRSEIVELSAPSTVVLTPGELDRAKPRLEVREGDKIAAGQVLFFDKKNPSFRYRSPVGGKITSIVLGRRRSLQQIHVEADRKTKAKPMFSTTPKDRATIQEALADSGLLALIQERPFSRPVQLGGRPPKSIFVNGMSNAPFRPDVHIVARGQEEAFQVGLDALNQLTDGPVHLCLDGNEEDPNPAVVGAQNVSITCFSGPHPSGNTSTHIYKLDPIVPGDVIWVVQGVDVALLGEYLMTGLIPTRRTISVAGSGMKRAGRRYVRAHLGQPVSDALGGELVDEETRIISGDIYNGRALQPDTALGLFTRGITVLKEDRRRRFFGWLNPGIDLWSDSRAYASKWFTPAHAKWDLGTSLNGSRRAMVLTGIYDKYVPLDILVDYLTRACIARDTDEAVRHGILGTDPEDFALCSVVCPSKTDFPDIIRRGLELIEAEGI